MPTLDLPGLTYQLKLVWADLALGREKGCEQRWSVWESQRFEGRADKPAWLKGQVCGDEGKAVRECAGASKPKSSRRLYPEDRGDLGLGGVLREMTESGWGQDRRPGLGWRRNGVTERKGWPGLTQLEERVKSKGAEGQGRPGHLRRCPAPPGGPGTWLWAVSDVRRGGAPSGLISSGGKRHFLGTLSDSACISCGPAGRHLCWTRRTTELEEG